MTDTFWSKVAVAGQNDCWNWQAGLRQGYGLYWNGMKAVAAHRHAVKLDGRDIPEGMVVDHVCRNRACVNPAHLRVVDRRTNAIENSIGHAARNVAKTHCPRGHPYEGDNLVAAGDSRKCKACQAIHVREGYWRSKGSTPPPLSESNTRVPLPDDMVAAIRNAEGSSRVVAARLGVSQSQVVRVRNHTRRASPEGVAARAEGIAQPPGSGRSE